MQQWHGKKRKLFRKSGTQENFGPCKELTATIMRKSPEGNNGIREQGSKQQLRLRKKTITGNQRKKQDTGAMSEKPEDIIRDPQTNFQVGYHEASSRDKAAQKTSKGWTLWRKQRAQQQCSKGIRKEDLKKLQLESMGSVIKTYRKTTRLEMAKRIARYTVGLQKIKD
jgi:hypothetical protein